MFYDYNTFILSYWGAYLCKQSAFNKLVCQNLLELNFHNMWGVTTIPTIGLGLVRQTQYIRCTLCIYSSIVEILDFKIGIVGPLFFIKNYIFQQ
jgi:hypothetical protein